MAAARTDGHTRLDGVGKVFARAGRADVVLRDCSLELLPGRLNVLIGPSGCGKSTLAKLIAGYLPPSVGQVSVDGVAVTGPSAERLMVFQETALFPWMTLLDNVAFGPRQAGVSPGEAKERARKFLARVGLQGFDRRYPEQLSGGMQRRAEVARALINRPRLLLLDEPFRGLDHLSRGLMQAYFLDLFEEDRPTTLFVTSEVDEAVLLADRVIVLTHKPTTQRTVVEVPLPRPRTAGMLELEQAVRIKRQLLDLLHEESGKAFAAPAPRSAA
ncbi:ABC transporter ATP-binding protein [Thauera sinica]|uniref:ABC transporter ATP-binding protein n=1 Tax=Thauera sinica TaxID=2665146 RepID=A0ABW1ANK6_9RHOO|nr:ABC transporter ATP-binding protein [Thauera sp. K11]ATE61595.1 ABC transporter [Thauera sp. K11]